MPTETHLHLAAGYDATVAGIVRLIRPALERIELHFRVLHFEVTTKSELDDASKLDLGDRVVWSATGMLRGGAGLVVGLHISEAMEDAPRGPILALADLAGRLGVRVVIRG